MSWLAAAQKVVKTQSFAMVNNATGAADGDRDLLFERAELSEAIDEITTHKSQHVALDLFTASMLVQVHAAMKPETQVKFEKLPLLRAVEIGWKAVS